MRHVTWHFQGNTQKNLELKSLKILKCSRSVCMWLFFELSIGDNRQPVFFYDGGKWNIITNLLQF